MTQPRKSRLRTRRTERLSPEAVKALTDILEDREELLTAEKAIKELEGNTRGNRENRSLVFLFSTYL